jgi:hypothetical protein
MVREHSQAIGSFLGIFVGEDGLFDASRVAEALRWNQEDIAGYLGKTPGAVSKNPTSATSQDALARLAAFVQHAYELNAHNMGLTVAWLRTPIRALDNKAPKQLITEQRLDVVENLLREMETGLAL